MTTKVVLSLSGGMDSTTLLGMAVKEHGAEQVLPVFFHYGSKHNPMESQAIGRLARHYHLRRLEAIDLTSAFRLSGSALMRSSDAAIPEGHYTDASMSATVVPGRNLVFGSVLAGMAEATGAPEVWLGVHAGDHAIYPDCRPSFINSLNYTVNQSSEGKVRVVAPFLRQNKTDILKVGLALGVPYGHTRTCYTSKILACGKCGSCTERREAFDNNGVTDPVPYQPAEMPDAA